MMFLIFININNTYYIWKYVKWFPFIEMNNINLSPYSMKN